MPRYSYSMVCGPMFAGKTSSLIADYHKAKARKNGVIILAPEMDTRHGGNAVVSHDGMAIGPVFRVRDFQTLSLAVNRLPRSRDLVIMIDECQFLDVGFSGDFLESIMFALSGRDVSVHLAFYGLDLDAWCNPWPMTSRIRLLPGIRVKTLTSRCCVCGVPAPYTDRHGAGDVVQVGGGDVYFPVCHEHHSRNAVSKKLEQAA